MGIDIDQHLEAEVRPERIVRAKWPQQGDQDKRPQRDERCGKVWFEPRPEQALGWAAIAPAIENLGRMGRWDRTLGNC